jgi:thiamine biosynthesis lipoprotein
MACTFEVLLELDDAGYAAKAARAAFGEIDRLEQELSRFVPHSDVSRINAARPGTRVCIGDDALGCLQLAARIREQTGGAFDVTFGSGQDCGAAPRGVRLVIDAAAHTVIVHQANTCLDLGAIGKGYALDRVADLLQEWGVQRAMLHSGQSTALALGSPSGKAAWSVGVRHPWRHGETIGQARLRDAALSGSGRLVHGDHIIDPRNGRPATHWDATWALARGAAESDALSTAFMVMDEREIREYCDRDADVGALALRGEVLVRAGLTFMLPDASST